MPKDHKVKLQSGKINKTRHKLRVQLQPIQVQIHSLFAVSFVSLKVTQLPELNSQSQPKILIHLQQHTIPLRIMNIRMQFRILFIVDMGFVEVVIKEAGLSQA